MDPTNIFGPENILLMEGDKGASLPKNPFIVGKSVLAAAGIIESARSEDRGSKYVLRTRSADQVEKLLKITELLDGTPVKVILHPVLNVSRCVISCFELIEVGDDIIQEELASQGVIKVQRITRASDDLTRTGRINTSSIILTFSGTVNPTHVIVGLLRIPTRPYYPNPYLCYACFKYGHGRARCPGPAVCSNCSGPHQLSEDEQCVETPHCKNCNGNHRPSARNCPVYKQEQEIVKIKVDNGISFREARARLAAGLGGASYAQAAAKTPVNPMSEELKRKDSELQALKAEIEKLKLFISTKLVPDKTDTATTAGPSKKTSTVANTSTTANAHTHMNKKTESSKGPAKTTEAPKTTGKVEKETEVKDKGKKKRGKNAGSQSPPSKVTRSQPDLYEECMLVDPLEISSDDCPDGFNHLSPE